MKITLKLLLILLPIFSANAEIYKHIDAEGRVTYSNVPLKGSTKLNLDPSSQGGGSGKTSSQARATPPNFPRVDPNTQKQRDQTRKSILESELETERKALEAAKAAYAEGEKNPEVFQNIVGPDGKPVLGAKEGEIVRDSKGEAVKGSDGNPLKFKKQGGRNMAKYAEKMDSLSSEIKNHQNNIEMLEKEISRM